MRTWSKKDVYKWLFLSHFKGPLLAGSYRTVHTIWGMMLGTMIKIIKRKTPSSKNPIVLKWPVLQMCMLELQSLFGIYCCPNFEDIVLSSGCYR